MIPGFQFKIVEDLLITFTSVTTIIQHFSFCVCSKVKIEVFQLVKHEVLSGGEGFQGEEDDEELEGVEEEEKEDEEEDGIGGMLNLDQEWL